MRVKFISKQSTFVKSYNWKNLYWELWKEKLNDVHYHGGKAYHLLNYLRPDSGKFLILESFTNTLHKTIHVIHFDDDFASANSPIEFKVGRDNEVDVRITDISVSRVHANLTFSNDNYYIKDNESKFGTLILLQSPWPIPYESNMTLTLQLGRYLGK